MGESFYYLISSLPMLSLDDPDRMTDAAFMDLCRGCLPASLYASLGRVSLLPDHVPCCAVERDWQVWETYVRNTIVSRRAGARGRDISSHVRDDADVFPGDRRRVEGLFEGGDPLLRERDLDSLRWERLDDLGAGHDFDFDAVVLYRLRLLLTAKWHGRSAENGLALRRSLIDRGVEQADAACRTVKGQPEP